MPVRTTVIISDADVSLKLYLTGILIHIIKCYAICSVE
jgi:hypothetical protein